MSILVRVPVTVAGIAALGSVAMGGCSSGGAPTSISTAPATGASTSAATVVTAPAAHTPAPLVVAPPTINTSNTAVTYDCGSQSPIAIVGADSTITLTGSCGEVDVNGAHNTVNLPTVAAINANGTGNHISWQAGPNGGAPQITNNGISNTVSGPGGANPPAAAPAPAPNPTISGPVTIGPGGISVGGGGPQIQRGPDGSVQIQPGGGG